MMEGTRSLWLFLLLNQLQFSLTDTDQDLSTMKTYSPHSQEPVGTTTPAMEPSLVTNDSNTINSTDGGPRADCLMDTEMGLIAVGSAGGLIVCLLVTTIVLSCQVHQLQRRVSLRRSSRSNMDLVSGAGYWGTDPAEVVGLVGPCDASVVLEEVTANSKTEEDRQAEIREAMEMEEAGAGLPKGATAPASSPEEKTSQMQSTNATVSCLEVPQDLEDMPLVV